ncbi:hypothetical protein RvY_03383 [Ramazzottius varieornatus]|uniref:DOMON domain-containing protein n=1 Tax=Ramazzottius varieornatus TaxID=947166 RepID=A0A1D1URN0_RAMVA|nr:hypothetical protein RvY_03383 [Ramazzottius varieornatus]
MHMQRPRWRSLFTAILYFSCFSRPAVCQHHSPASSSGHASPTRNPQLEGQRSRRAPLTLTNSAVLLSRRGSPQEALLSAYWGSNDTHFLLQLEGRTVGWMAFGMSPTGRMDLSGVMFGWCNDIPASLAGWDKVISRMPTASFHPTINSATCYTQDRLIRVYREEQRVDLLTDAIQDWQLISGRQNATHTLLRAVRPFISSALQSTEYPITREVMAIFAVGSADPDVATGEVSRCLYKGSRLLTLLPLDPHSDGASHSGSSSESAHAQGGTSVHPAGPNAVADLHSNDNDRDRPAEATTPFNTTLLHLISKTLDGLGQLLNAMSKSSTNPHSRSEHYPSQV